MITAWDIYWVMQLDSIGSFFGWLAFPACLIGCAFWCVRRFAISFDDKESQSVANNMRVGRVILAVGLLSWAASAALPSTKTAAMMLVIPAVANNEAIQKEAGDLYGIAKDALRELARPKQEKSK